MHRLKAWKINLGRRNPLSFFHLFNMFHFFPRLFFKFAHFACFSPSLSASDCLFYTALSFSQKPVAFVTTSLSLSLSSYPILTPLIYIPCSSSPSPVFLIAKSMLKVREQVVSGTASEHGYPLPPLPRNLCVYLCGSFLSTHEHTSFHLSHLNLC